MIKLIFENRRAQQPHEEIQEKYNICPNTPIWSRLPFIHLINVFQCSRVIYKSYALTIGCIEGENLFTEQKVK